MQKRDRYSMHLDTSRKQRASRSISPALQSGFLRYDRISSVPRRLDGRAAHALTMQRCIMRDVVKMRMLLYQFV